MYMGICTFMCYFYSVIKVGILNKMTFEQKEKEERDEPCECLEEKHS